MAVLDTAIHVFSPAGFRGYAAGSQSALNCVTQKAAFGREAREDERRRGAEVGSRDGRALQARGPCHDRSVAFHMDVRAEADQLAGVEKPVLEDGLDDARDTARLRHERQELGLEVGRKAGMGRGLDVGGVERGPG